MRPIPLLALGAVWLAPAVMLLAAPPEKTPGATLIVPYFEVDLDAPDGRSTLISVGNAGEPVVARATVWSDWGKPLYAWDIYLAENALATYNLRDLLAYGTLPPTHAPAGFGGCGDPVATPALSPTDLLSLQKGLSGQDLGGGVCASEPRHDPSLATGSITIDAVSRCSSAPIYPGEYGYFTGASPLASPRLVLWGDFTLVDPAENFAQGYEAPALGVILTVGYPTFGNWPADPAVAREALSDLACSRGRFLEGGPFAARTSFFVYTPPRLDFEYAYCFEEGGPWHWDFLAFDEAGSLQSSLTPDSLRRRTSARVEAGADLGLAAGAGYVELKTRVSVGGVIMNPQPAQQVVLGAIQASGRFAVGFAGNPMPVGDCR